MDTQPNTEWRFDTNEANVEQSEASSPEGYIGSMQQILSKNTGLYVTCEFLVGTQNIEVKEGILYSVGVSYIVIYDVDYNRYSVCDFYSLKFITFYEPGRRPRRQINPEEVVR